MSQFQIGVKLVADGDGFSQEIRAATKELDQLESSSGQIGTTFSRSARIIQDASIATSGLRVEAGNLQREYSGLSSAISGLDILSAAQNVIETTIQFRGFEESLKITTGSVQAASDAMAFVRDTADSLGLVNKDLTASFVQLSQAAQGTGLAGEDVEAIFANFARAGVAFQHSNAEMEDGFVALGGMLAHSTLSMEDFGQGLTRFLPDAVAIAARAMDMSVEDFSAALAQGEIATNEFIPKFTAQLEQEIPHGVQATNAAFNELTNSLDDLSRNFGESGGLAAMEAMARGAAGAIGVLADNTDILVPLVAALTVGIGTRLATAMGKKVFKAFVVDNAAAIGSLRMMAKVAPLTATRLTVVAGAARAARLAMGFLGGPIGFALSALTLGMGLFSAANSDAASATDSLTESIEKQNRALTEARQTTLEKKQAALTEAERNFAEITKIRDETQSKLNALTVGFSNAGSMGGILPPDFIKFLQFINSITSLFKSEEIENLENELNEINSDFTKAKENVLLAKKGVDEESNNNKNSLEDRVIQLISSLDPEFSNKNKNNNINILLENAESAGIDPALLDRARALINGPDLKKFDELVKKLDPAAKKTNELTDATELLSAALSANIIDNKRHQELLASLNKLYPSVADSLENLNAQFADELRLQGLSEKERQVESLTRAKVQEIETQTGKPLTPEEKERVGAEVQIHLDALEALKERQAAEAAFAQEITNIWNTAHNSIKDSFHRNFSELLSGNGKAFKNFFKDFTNARSQAVTKTLSTALLTKGKVENTEGMSDVAKGILGGLGKLKEGDGPEEGTFAGGIQSFFAETGELFKPLTKSLKGSLEPLFGNMEEIMGEAFGGAQMGGMVAGISDALGLGLSGTGSQIGGALGAAIGGPIGSIIGSIGGGIIGSFFGSTPQSSATITTDEHGGSVTSSFGKGEGREDQAITLADSIIGGISQIASALNADIAAGLNLGSIGTRKKKFVFDPSGQGRVKGSGVQSFDTEEKAVRAALRAALAKGAVEGLSDAVRKAINSNSDLDKALDTALKVQQVEQLIESMTDPFTSAFRDFERQAADRLDIARRFNLDVVTLEKATAKERTRLLDQQLSATVGPLRNLLDDLNLGSRAEGSALERRAALLAEQQRLEAAVDSGDLDAIDELAQISDQLLRISEEAFGSAGDFSDDRGGTVGLLERLLSSTEDRIREAADRARDEAGTGEKTVDKLAEANDSLDDLVLGQNRLLGEFGGLRKDLLILTAPSPVFPFSHRVSAKAF